MIEDSTVSGVPLPHPDNPAKADVARIRDALTALDARQVAAGETASDLADAIAAEATARGAAVDGEAMARSLAVAAEQGAREDAIEAEQMARAAAVGGLQDQIDGLPAFDPDGYYTKAETEALITPADDIEVVISGTPATVDFTIGADDRFVHILWDDISHNDASNRNLELRYSTDAGATWSGAAVTLLQSAVANTTPLTGGLHLWLMSDETATGFYASSTTDVTAISVGAIASLTVDTPARINRIRLQWAAGSFDAGVVRCRKSK